MDLSEDKEESKMEDIKEQEKQPSSPSSSSSSRFLKQESKEPEMKTVSVFDWDDTLLASSFLAGKGFKLDSEIEKSVSPELQLPELESSVVAVLTLALSFGPVCIVTNAEHGWVQMSAEKFIPGVLPLLSKVKVLSARSTYEKMHPDSPVKWKFCAFQEILNGVYGNGFDSKSTRNVISFGDSHVEREAVRAVTRGLPNTKTKSVKFAERPSMEQLRRQIELVTNCFAYIHNHEGDLDLQLTVTVNVAAGGNGGSGNSNGNSAGNGDSSSSSSSSSTTTSANQQHQSVSSTAVVS